MKSEKKSEQGLALISSILLLGMLTLVGSALLATTTMDVTISDNYRTNTQLLFLAEMGIEDGREKLRTTVNDVSTELDTAAGLDDTLSTSRDLTTLLGEDDQPWLPSALADRTGGQSYVDPDGRTIGTYHVFLRNDAVDGLTSRVDTNNVLTLLSIARIGDRTRIVEVDVKRGGFGDINGALTLDGPVNTFLPANSNLFEIDGTDQCGGPSVNAIGVVEDDDVTQVVDSIPSGRITKYIGLGGFPDVANVSDDLDPNLQTPIGMEGYVQGFERAATETYYPAYGEYATIGNIGSDTDPHVVVVNGDAVFGPGTGHGALVVRGKLTVQGNFTWNGLILVIGQGEIDWNGGGRGVVNGSIFMANTRENRTSDNPIGTIRSDLGEIVADFDGGGGNGIYYDSCALSDLYLGMAFSRIAVREF
jgi:hypothetical protein